MKYILPAAPKERLARAPVAKFGDWLRRETRVLRKLE
jgi:hypothetical protein